MEPWGLRAGLVIQPQPPPWPLFPPVLGGALPSAFPLLPRGCSWLPCAVLEPWVLGRLGCWLCPKPLSLPQPLCAWPRPCFITDPISLSAACQAASAPAAGTAPSGGSQAGTGAARLGPLLCSSPRCWTQAATTTVSTPLHRRDPLHLSPEHSDPSPSYPGPCAKFICCFLPRIPGAVATSSPGQLLATSVVVSLC